jgi:hypothetical protein
MDRILEEPCEATSLMHGFEAERRGRLLRLGSDFAQFGQNASRIDPHVYTVVYFDEPAGET